MNDLSAHRTSQPDGRDSPQESRENPGIALHAGDVCVKRGDDGFGIFNYRGERVIDKPVPTCAEAVRLAREIVTPWNGRVVVDDPPESEEQRVG